ncbi:NifU family protein [Patescibacteria group bacterium]|nr:NifU family protein [Patescibacteria group bacterium]
MTDNIAKFKQDIETALEEVRDALILHGGNVELVDADPVTGLVKVRLHGACVGCPMATMTLKDGIEATLVEKVPNVKEVIGVE